LIAAGYPYELAGLLYYVLFLLMSRKQNAKKYTRRSRVFVLLAAIVMVACVPLHFADAFLGVMLMYVLAIAGLVSMAIDSAKSSRAG
jgi:hypothetical protein